MEYSKVRKSRASSSEEARRYRKQGHDDALRFAQLIGLEADYKNDPKAKKDVIDLSGDAHSVKGGVKKWQIFLYGLNRFTTDNIFGAMNGMGQLLVECINSFPVDFEEYHSNKSVYKEKLQPHMIALAEKMKDKTRLRAFLSKSMFNGGEVDYLTVLEGNKYHIFWGKQIVDVFSEELEVGNSIARTDNQMSFQKVIMKYKGNNLAEIEMRNDSVVHYREIRFNMVKPKAMELIFDKITDFREFNNEVIVYGEAIKKFGRW